MVSDAKGLLALLGLLLALLASPATAQDAGKELFRGQQGPYMVSVSVLPENTVVGTLHFSVAPLDAATSLPVTDARIVLVANNPDPSGPAFQARALDTPAAPGVYLSNITFNKPGLWTLAVTLESAALGEATLNVPLEVGPQPIGPSPGGAFVFLGVLFVLVGGVAYLWYSARRRAKQGAP